MSQLHEMVKVQQTAQLQGMVKVKQTAQLQETVRAGGTPAGCLRGQSTRRLPSASCPAPAPGGAGEGCQIRDGVTVGEKKKLSSRSCCNTLLKAKTTCRPSPSKECAPPPTDSRKRTESHLDYTESTSRTAGQGSAPLRTVRETGHDCQEASKARARLQDEALLLVQFEQGVVVLLE